MADRTISPESSVHRGVRRAWVVSGALSYAAFMLSANDMKSVPPGLSVSERPASAFASLGNLAGVASLVVGNVTQLTDPHGSPMHLGVIPVENPHDPYYCWIVGLPPYSEPGTEGEVAAITAAGRMLSIATYQGGEPG